MSRVVVARAFNSEQPPARWIDDDVTRSDVRCSEPTRECHDAKSGYIVNLADYKVSGTQLMSGVTSCVSGLGGGLYSSYFAEAHPATVGGTGTRSFATDTRGTLFQDTTGATAANPIALSATVQ